MREGGTTKQRSTEKTVLNMHNVVLFRTPCKSHREHGYTPKRREFTCKKTCQGKQGHNNHKVHAIGGRSGKTQKTRTALKLGLQETDLDYSPGSTPSIP